MAMDSIWKWVVLIGVGVALFGLLLGVLSRIPGLSRLGNLPGDIRYTSPGGGFSCFVPIVSSIVLSILLTIVLNLVVRLINR